MSSFGPDSDLPAIEPELVSGLLTAGGRPPLTAPLSVEALTGGRTGAQVVRLRSADRSFVLKLSPETSWRQAAMRCPESGEARLWRSGLPSSLSGPIRWPVIEVGREAVDGRVWILMDDVSAGIRDRGEFTRADTRTFFSALAHMQAAFWEDDALSHPSLPMVGGPVRLLAEPALHLASRRSEVEPWVHAFLSDFKVIGAFLPIWLDTLGPQLADAWLDLVADESWVRRLEALPPTLLQGDTRRANISFAPDRIALFDWEFAAKGPAASDLQMHCYFHYWAYPPKDTEPGDDCDDLRDEHAASLRELGVSLDPEAYRQGWDLGWVKMIVQLGFILVDPLYPDGGTADERSAIAALCTRAVQRALDARSAYA